MTFAIEIVLERPDRWPKDGPAPSMHLEERFRSVYEASKDADKHIRRLRSAGLRIAAYRILDRDGDPVDPLGNKLPRQDRPA